MPKRTRVPASKSRQRTGLSSRPRWADMSVSETGTSGMRPSPSAPGVTPSGTSFLGGRQGNAGKPAQAHSVISPANTSSSNTGHGMRDRGKPRSQRFGLGRFVGLALLLMLGITFFVRQSQVRQMEKYIEALEQEIQYYTQANDNLRDQINMLRSDQYIEKVAREKLGLVKPGEVQYILTDPTATGGDTTGQNPGKGPGGVTER